MARKCLVSVYPTCPLLFTQKPTLRPLSWSVPDHTPPAHPVCPAFPFVTLLCHPDILFFEYSRALRSTSTRFLCLPPLPLPFACYMYKCNVFLRKTLLCALPFRVSDQNCVPFFVDPMRGTPCTHFILLYFIIIIMRGA
jgi:hypothetical protein